MNLTNANNCNGVVFFGVEISPFSQLLLIESGTLMEYSIGRRSVFLDTAWSLTIGLTNRMSAHKKQTTWMFSNGKIQFRQLDQTIQCFMGSTDLKIVR